MRLLPVAMAVMLHELVTLVAIISCPGYGWMWLSVQRPGN
jgi:hypothetical protein